MVRQNRGDLLSLNLFRVKECGSSAPLVGRRFVLRVVLFSVVTALGSSRSSGASATTAPIEQLYAALQTVMKAGKTAPFRQRYDVLAPVIVRTFDLDGILESSVGPRWTTLPSEQQSALKEAFRRYTIAIYVTNFDSFSGQRFEVQPSSVAAGGDQIVPTRIVPASGEAHRLDYVMRQAGGTWKIVDVLADGSISRVAVQRSEMRTPIANGGGPALLDRLQKKTAEMSGGQPLP
jgi:phospholipid transport system substrate-binding protein